MKPYTTKLPASGCLPGTVIWFGDGDDGFSQPVLSYRQWWGVNGYRGTWINGRLYVGRTNLQVVVGAGTRR